MRSDSIFNTKRFQNFYKYTFNVVIDSTHHQKSDDFLIACLNAIKLYTQVGLFLSFNLFGAGNSVLQLLGKLSDRCDFSQ